MSTNSVVYNNGQQAIITTDLTKIFIWNNRYDKGIYTNSTYADVTLLAGQLIGRVGSSQELKPMLSTNTDGSQYPLGILADNYTVVAGAQQELAFCVAGDVAEEKVVLTSPDALATLIGSTTRSIRDHIAGDTVGIKLVASTQNTDYDNQ